MTRLLAWRAGVAAAIVLSTAICPAVARADDSSVHFMIGTSCLFGEVTALIDRFNR